MNKKIKTVLASGFMAAATLAPLGFALSCGPTATDLTKTIVVLAPEKKDAEGNVTYPMDKVWDEAISKFKAENSGEAAKYEVKKLRMGHEQYEKLSTAGITGDQMPDIWYFPTDKMDLINTRNKAIAEVNQSVVDKVAKESGIKKDNISFEKSDGKNYGFRFKDEIVMMWMNKDRLSNTYAKAGDMITAIFKDNPVIKDIDGNAVVSGTLTVSEWFDKIETKAAGNATFTEKKTAVAKVFSDNLDLSKVGEVMKDVSGNSPADQRLKSLLTVDGSNGWFVNGMVYAKGLTGDNGISPTGTLKGLIWEDKAGSDSKLRSIYGSINDNTTKVPKTMESWFNISKYSNDSNINPAQDFQKSLQSFSIEGTWMQKDFSDNFAKMGNEKDPKNPNFAEENLYSFPLPLVNGMQMRHYRQGWNFGINSRNKEGEIKYNAVGSLLSKLYSPAVQKIYYSNVENYLPGNLNEPSKNEMYGTKKQYIQSSIDLVVADEDRFVVNRNQIDPIYGSVGTSTSGWDQIYADILLPLKKTESGKVTLKDYAEWQTKVKTYLTGLKIHGIND